ncbi:hypothetical protein CU098_010070 [Rhizopus stolonifer]|uniref:Zinc finger CCCH-type with G patch domain-containing protein n=1 Tax=Rhizopus stolonifer TaxID=4846 RepID=A0A367KRQ2_RHIST|nr:hypothetical protein CU098_010070 [Rhizopus stolonifer]
MSQEFDLASLTDQEILGLLDQEDLPEELYALITEYQHALTTTNKQSFPVGDKCAITFSFEKYVLLLPAIVLDYQEDNTVIQVMILTPITTDTVPCHDYFGAQQTCKSNTTSCPYEQSHGYSLSTELVVPFEALGTEDPDTLTEQLQYGKRVLCKEKNQDIWKMGNIIDQLYGPRWRVRLKDKKRIQVDMEHIMPVKNVLDDQSSDSSEEWSESDQEEREKPNDEFGGWQAHSTGFAAKMMAKMGYVQGKGLGVDGSGRVNPVQVQPYTMGKPKFHGIDNSRPGLGLQNKPKQTKKEAKKKQRDQPIDMFGFMNTLLDQQKKPAPESSVKPINLKDTRQTNQTIAKLRANVEQAQTNYIHAGEAYRRNKGSPMENQFRTRLKDATHQYENLKKQLDQLETQVKRTKEKKDMYTF